MYVKLTADERDKMKDAPQHIREKLDEISTTEPLKAILAHTEEEEDNFRGNISLTALFIVIFLSWKSAR